MTCSLLQPETMASSWPTSWKGTTQGHWVPHRPSHPLVTSACGVRGPVRTSPTSSGHNWRAGPSRCFMPRWTGPQGGPGCRPLTEDNPPQLHSLQPLVNSGHQVDRGHVH